jgi:hypothetical protein
MNLTVSITGASGGNFENLVVDDTPAVVEVSDNMTQTTVVLSVDPENAQEGDTVTYTATLSNPAQGQVTVDLDNGLQIIIEDGQTTGSVQYTIPDDAYNQEPSEPPTPPAPTGELSIADIENSYIGAFRMPRGRYGVGTITIDPVTKTMFADDWVNGNLPVFQTEIPGLVNETEDLSVLNVATELQAPVDMLPKIPQTEWDAFGTAYETRVWSLFHDGEHLLLGGIIYYNASQDGTDTTIRIENPADMQSSSVEGCFKFQYAHAGSRFIAPVPAEHQAAIGGDLISGAGLGFPIVGRLSLGNSGFGLLSNDLKTATTGAVIPQVEHMNFKDSWMHPDYLNYEGACGRENNDLYVTNSSSTYGFIVGGYYIVLGYSEGFEPGPFDQVQTDIDGYTVQEPGQECSNPYVGTTTDAARPNGEIFYKNDTNDWADDQGHVGGGYVCYDSTAKSPYVWIYRVSDLTGAENPTDPRPFAYGPISLPFSFPKGPGEHADEIAGATFDPTTNILYINHAFAGAVDEFAQNYTILAYDLTPFI